MASITNSHLFLETKRLIIRPFTIDDIDAAYTMNLDPEVTKYTADGGVVSKEEVARRITQDVMGDYTKYGYGRLAVELKAENKFIGFCGLKYLEDMDEVDLGYRFMQDYWGNGFATESSRACVDFGFEILKLKRIIALVIPANMASVNVLDKLNFNYEKEYREEDLLAKQYVLLKNE